MSSIPLRRAIPLGAALALLLASGAVGADKLPKEIRKAFGGDILFARSELPAPDTADPRGAIKQLRKESVSSLTHEDVDGVPTWTFHFMAFMKRSPGVSQVSLDFYTADREKLFVAQERLAGINPRLTLLASRVTLSEDDGLTKGRNYIVKLTAKVKGRERVLATGKLTTR